MDGIFIVVLCLSGCFTFSTCLLRHYRFVSEPMNWTEAQSYCRERYTDLATIESAEQIQKVKDAVSAAGYGSEVWIGVYSVIDWKWSDGFTGTGAEYTNWEPSNPNYLSTKQLCVAMTGHGIWYDRGCRGRSKSVCYRGTLEDSDFVLVNTTKTWSEAQTHCRESYTDLATVRNFTENNRTNIWRLGGFVWIGLYRDPQIYWSDGSDYSYSSWQSGSHYVKKTRACGVAQSNDGSWTLYSCGQRYPFVCYSNLTAAKTFVKVRVKLQDSSVDMNDPAVKEQILKKLQDKLKAEGHDGVTLKWKETDGKVFKKKAEL